MKNTKNMSNIPMALKKSIKLPPNEEYKQAKNLLYKIYENLNKILASYGK